MIPSYNEISLLPTLNSIAANKSRNSYEVIILFNNSDSASEEIKNRNRNAYQEVCNANLPFKVIPIYVYDIPTKIAGVGVARRIGMDEAYYRFKSIQHNGIISCLDADCEIAPNYIKTIIDYFDQEDKIDAVSIHYEHPLNDIDDLTRKSIIDYELHLRYHVDFQKHIGLPYAYQTVGSSMAVRSEAYRKQGGMNRRKAGEDFYFIHKFTSIDSLGEIKTTTVFPSPRISHRVPFGTGKAIYDMSEGKIFGTYHWQSYLALIPLVKGLEDLYQQNKLLADLKIESGVVDYLASQDFDQQVISIRKNTSNFLTFKKRFYQWFNAFRLMKYLHFMRDHHYPNISAKSGAAYLYELLEEKSQKNYEAVDYLYYFRKLDQKL